MAGSSHFPVAACNSACISAQVSSNGLGGRKGKKGEKKDTTKTGKDLQCVL